MIPITTDVYQVELDRLSERLASGEILRQPIVGDRGHMHVDRLQPYLCIYRKPLSCPVPGTGRLLFGQASYLLADTSEEIQPFLKGLIETLTDLMVEAFGAALVLELWSRTDEPVATDAPPPPARYRIVAAEYGAPAETIDVLENGILKTDDGRGVEISICYCSGAAPPGSAPLLPTKTEAREELFLLGLEVPPIYLDGESGKIVPSELRRLTNGLGRSIRQAAYTFSHTHARTRPEHFHELGRRAMTDEVGTVDRGLSWVSDSFDLLLHATPVNAEAAFERFRSDRFGKDPEFLYRPQTNDPGELKRQLFGVPLESVEDPALYNLFAAQRDELDRMITMLSDRNTLRFLLGSQQVFGTPDARLLSTAHEILKQSVRTEKAADISSLVGAREFARAAEAELRYYRNAWPDLPARVEIRDDVPGVMVSKGHFLVGSKVAVAQRRIEPLLHHEIGTHILTYYNGQQQPISQLHSGMPGYEETQEGLAVLSELLCGGLDPERFRTLAGRVVAVWALIAGADFVETFRLLSNEHGFDKRNSFTIAMRVHRAGGLTKDIVYLRGLMALLDYLFESHPIEDLLVGKVALEYMEIIEELRWRNVISAARLKPRYLDEPEARRRLQRLPGGAEAADLMQSMAK